MSTSIGRLLATLLLATFSMLAHSAEMPTNAVESPSQAALRAAIHGPKSIALIDQAMLDLPASFQFIPKAEATALLSAMGNQPGDDLLGLIVSENPGSSWMVVARFEKAGYIKDDDAAHWNADDLLKSLKEGAEAGNEERRKKGIPEFVVGNWVQTPTYESTSHRLVWAAETLDKNPTKDSDPGINYNTYALGRDGYVSLNLVTGLNAINAHKPVAQSLLSALKFNANKRYEDFNAGTDRVAEYGLAALIGGVAAKKIGLFAVAAAFAVKFFKLIAIAVVGGLAAVRKFFGRNSET